MKTAQTSLQKRLHSDTILTYIVAGLLGLVSVISLFYFFLALDNARLAGSEYTGDAPGDILRETLLYMFIAVAMLLFSFVLREIHRTGKPFSKMNVNRFRAMAFILIFASIIPEAAKGLVGFADPTATDATFQLLNARSLCVMFFGVVCGLVSEIFKYGYELQDSMDSIA